MLTLAYNRITKELLPASGTGKESEITATLIFLSKKREDGREGKRQGREEVLENFSASLKEL